eukprot:SAG31_NODE_37456_length_304_cov_0.756098_1_plen_46_part_10
MFRLSLVRYCVAVYLYAFACVPLPVRRIGASEMLLQFYRVLELRSH